MRHALHVVCALLVSALLVAGLTTVVPANAHAATAATGVWSWGDNTYGMVGDGTTTQRLRPVRVVGLADVFSITTLAWHTAYAVKTDGTVWRWGKFYQPDPSDPGDGTEVIIKTPTKVPGLSGVKSIALEQFNGFAVKSDGTVWGWEFLNSPAPVAGLTDVASISLDLSGFGGYALKRDGTVWGFRWRDGGASVAKLDGINGVSRLASGVYSVDGRLSWYAVKSDGTVWAWGDNQTGQLGDGTKTDRAAPVRVSGLTGVAKVTAANGAAFAVTAAGAVWAWGCNGGQLGDGTMTDRATPVRLTVLSQVAEVIPPDRYSGSPKTWYARTTGGLVYYWGCGWPSHYGDAPEIYQRCGKVPLELPGLTGVRKVATYDVYGGGWPDRFGVSGSDGGYAIKNDGSLWVWGGHGGALSNGWAPVRVPGLSGVTVTAVFPYAEGAYAIGTQLPTVTGLSPSRGSSAAGDTITITGTNLTGATSVKFGIVAATSVRVVSATKITCKAPAHAVGKVDVKVTTPKGTSSASGTGDDYTYFNLYQQSDAKLTYLGAWSTGTAPSASGGSFSSSDGNGAAVLVNFTGTSVNVIARKAPWYGKASVSIDGGTASTVDLYSASTLYGKVVYGKTGLANVAHTMVIKRLKQKNTAATGYAISLDALQIVGKLSQAAKTTVYQQDNARLHYAGTWAKASNTAASAGTYVSANAAGAKITVTFTGSYLTWFAKTAPSYGKAKVTLDGGTPVIVDLYSPAEGYKKQVYNTGLLTKKQHTLVIQWTGTKRTGAGGTAISADAFGVLGALY